MAEQKRQTGGKRARTGCAAAADGTTSTFAHPRDPHSLLARSLDSAFHGSSWLNCTSGGRLRCFHTVAVSASSCCCGVPPRGDTGGGQGRGCSPPASATSVEGTAWGGVEGEGEAPSHSGLCCSSGSVSSCSGHKPARQGSCKPPAACASSSQLCAQLPVKVCPVALPQHTPGTPPSPPACWRASQSNSNGAAAG